MSKIIIIQRKHLLMIATIVLIMIIFLEYAAREKGVPANTQVTGARMIHMVAGKFESVTKDGKIIEAYRWDPGTIPVKEGELVKLSIYGINGESHPFVIEGLNVKGEVKKGQETVVTFTASKKGIYRMICFAHPDIAHNGPMIAYIVVN
ncbi:cupredoxin domain-containing protein [Ferviditalea candida]|uniref:Cupredoxin domain-containing protein n=1 Tax=Ferviditalea candida TaxID=3108399 RepID=A0ABU5ZI31_9BACL|nr:cupredoxin domain-containing protein [Paenibacillaceae bacterium T2]